MGRVTKDNPASITAPECGVAGFHIDCDSGLITHCDAAAATLTGATTADSQGQPWSSVICCQPPAPSALELAIAARVTGSLSPFILQSRDGKELIVAGMFVALAHSTSAVVLL